LYNSNALIINLLKLKFYFINNRLIFNRKQVKLLLKNKLLRMLIMMTINSFDLGGGIYSPEQFFGCDTSDDLDDLECEMMINAKCAENQLTLRDLDKVWFIGTVTGSIRFTKGVILSAIYAIALLGQLFVYRETSPSLRNSLYIELHDIKRGFIALFPVMGGMILVHLEKEVDRQIMSEALGMDPEEFERKFVMRPGVTHEDFSEIDSYLKEDGDWIIIEGFGEMARKEFEMPPLSSDKRNKEIGETEDALSDEEMLEKLQMRFWLLQNLQNSAEL